MTDDDALDNNPRVSVRALEALHDDLFGWCLTRCSFERDVAEDLMQQAYVEMLSGKARFDGASSLKTFVFAVVQKLARSRFRQLGIRLRLLATHGSDLYQMETDASNDCGETNSAIWKAVERLPARQRDITELVFCRDMTIEEASSVMGVTIGTGRVHYDRAKKALAGALAELREAAQ
jgi:RNA polymerase sigma-70 factor (ECF subfamily)